MPIKKPHRASPGPADSAHYTAMVEALMHFRLVLRSMRRHYRSVEEQCGVSGAQLWAMAEIAASPGLKVNDLAKELAIHQSTASNILDKLEGAGLVDRRRMREDRRVVRIFLTATGTRTLRRAPTPSRGVLQQALLELSTSSLKALNRHLAELVRHTRLQDATDASKLLPEAAGFTVPRRMRASAGAPAR